VVCLREKSRKGRDAFPLSVLHLCTCGAYATTKGGGGGELLEVAPWRYSCAGFAVWTLP